MHTPCLFYHPLCVCVCKYFAHHLRISCKENALLLQCVFSKNKGILLQIQSMVFQIRKLTEALLSNLQTLVKSHHISH